MSDYHSLPGLSSGVLRAFARSPWHARHDLNDPTPSKMVGSIIHAAILEPHRVDYTIAYVAEEARQAGKRPLSKAAVDAALARADEIRDDVWALIGGPCDVERTVAWTMDGVECKAKPDALPLPRLIDLKHSRDPDPRGFANAIARYLYHYQMAWYEIGCRAAGIPITEWAWIVYGPKVGDPPPAIYPADGDDRARALAEVRDLFDRYRSCTDWSLGWSRVIKVPGWGWRDTDQIGCVVDAADIDQEDEDE